MPGRSTRHPLPRMRGRVGVGAVRRLGAGAGDPRIGAREALSVDQRAAPACAASGRASVRALGHRPDRSRAARRAVFPPAAVRRARSSRCGHGASGLTWSGVTGETPPQSLIPAAIISSNRVRHQIGRRLEVHRRAEDQPRHGNRPQMLGEIRLGRVRHARAGLGAEILDDDFLNVAVALMQVAQREQRLDALPRGSRRCRSGCPR